MKIITVILASILVILLAGCEDAGTAQRTLLEQLQGERSQLTAELAESKAKEQQLQQQVRTLSGLKGDVDLEELYDLKRIKLTRYTNLYDKDKDGKFEKLIVYVQPIDSEGDVRKAVGEVDVELWDLSRPNGQAMIGKWQVGPEELKGKWYSLMVINYRLVFDVSGIVEDYTEPLTVKVTFTDYLTGKVFKEQKIIKRR